MLKILIKDIDYYNKEDNSIYKHIVIEGAKISNLLKNSEDLNEKNYDYIIEGSGKCILPSFFTCLFSKFDFKNCNLNRDFLSDKEKVKNLIKNGVTGFLNDDFISKEYIKNNNLNKYFTIFNIDKSISDSNNNLIKIDLSNMDKNDILKISNSDCTKVIHGLKNLNIQSIKDLNLLGEKSILLLDRELTEEEKNLINGSDTWIMLSPVYNSLSAKSIGTKSLNINKVLLSMVEDFNVLRNLRQFLVNERIINHSPDSPTPFDIFKISNSNYYQLLNLNKNDIQIGSTADLIIVNKNLSMSPVHYSKTISNFVHTGQINSIDTVISKGNILMDCGKFLF